MNIKCMAPPTLVVHHVHTAYHHLQIKGSNVSSKPAGLDLSIHVIICSLTTECGCIIKSSESLCKLMLNECYCHTIYDKKIKSLMLVPGSKNYLIDIVTFVTSYHLQP